VILSGGAGTRGCGALSRELRPKQLLNLFSGPLDLQETRATPSARTPPLSPEADA